MRLLQKSFLLIGVVLFVSGSLIAAPAHVTTQDDTVRIPDVQNDIPLVDGQGSDACWQTVNWQTIDQVWIPYGGSVSADDYEGRYKIVWSSVQNLLYFLIEVYDDVGVDGFNPDGSTADVYNYDIAEVFIDENRSGGDHIFDQGGTNAENAFSYHIYADFPEDGQVTTEHFVGDLAGTSWSHVNYAAHLPEFALRKDGNQYVREFSLKVYDDTYDNSNPEASRVQLAAGKLMGLSLAICENDDLAEEPKERDNFFGSVWVTAARYNSHWENADDYGAVLLVSGASSVSDENQLQDTGFRLFPNPSSGSIRFHLDSPQTGNYHITIYNVLGREVARLNGNKTGQTLEKRMQLSSLPQGIYFVHAEFGDHNYIQKMTLTNGRL